MSVKPLAKIEGYFYAIFATKTLQELRFISIILPVKSPTIERNIAHRKSRLYGGLKPFRVVKNIIMPFSIFFQVEQYYSAKLFCNLNDCIDKYKMTSHFLPTI